MIKRREGKYVFVPEKTWEIMHYYRLDVDSPGPQRLYAKPKDRWVAKPPAIAGTPTTSPAAPVDKAIPVLHRANSYIQLSVPTRATVFIGRAEPLERDILLIPISRTENTICFKTVRLHFSGTAWEQYGSVPLNVFLTPGAAILDFITAPWQVYAWAKGAYGGSH